jgi:peroxiredoxin Q/BCP
VSFDTPEENQAFAEKFSFPYPLLCDTQRAMGLAYQTCSSPTDQHASRHTYVIDGSGVITHAIDTRDPGAQADTLLSQL